MIEGSGAESVLVTNGSGCGSGRPKNISIRIRIPNTASLYSLLLLWLIDSLVLCEQDPDPVRYGHRPDPAGAGAEAGHCLHRERHRQRILVTQVGVFLGPDPGFLPDADPENDKGSIN